MFSTLKLDCKTEQNKIYGKPFEIISSGILSVNRIFCSCELSLHSLNVTIVRIGFYHRGVHDGDLRGESLRTYVLFLVCIRTLSGSLVLSGSGSKYL